MMAGTELYVSLVVGVLISLVYVEKTGLLPAGLIVPGYLALIFTEFRLMAVVFGVALLTYLLVVHVVARFIVLFGRRKFAAMLTVGIACKLAIDAFYPIIPFEVLELRGLGVVVPGLIANAFHRQGVLPTVLTTLLLSGATFLVVFAYVVVVSHV
jgi:gamma-polyglutamate biosynthesis protein CapC